MAKLAAARLNERFRASAVPPSSTTAAPSEVAIHVPMDGYHYTRAVLRAMSDPAGAVARRGAAFTFDAAAFLDLVARIRRPASRCEEARDDTTISAPAYDHAIHDPSPDAVRVQPWHRVVLFEGLYVALRGLGADEEREYARDGPTLDDEGKQAGGDVERQAELDRRRELLHPAWGEAARLMDERWLVRVDRGVAVDRLVGRHVRTRVGTDAAAEEGAGSEQEETARKERAARLRAETNDMRNGDWLLARLVPEDEIDEVLLSVDDGEVVREAEAVGGGC